MRGLKRATLAVALLAGLPMTQLIDAAHADQGGVSFWLPGTYGSLAATPQMPGWALATVYYHTSVSAGGAVSASRQATLERLSPTLNINLNANLDARADMALIIPSYVFETPVFGGQLALSMATVIGRNRTSLDGTLTASVGGLAVTRQGSIDSSVAGFGDLYPRAELRWNAGVHNFMTYAMGDIPVGSYEVTRLANLGIGHAAIDGGAGYTYFDAAQGNEFSAVAGLTYNFKNSDVDYRNGIDFHVEWGLSKFLSKQFHIGAVGYYYNQLTDDSGAPAMLDGFRSRVAAIGPQMGFVFPVGNMQGYLNLKGYWEFDAKNRPEGWNTWVTFVISPPHPHPTKASARPNLK
ncbi:MAG: transporter [Pseudorhodoplanes sp.]|jgi:hypothetical protein|nr:transporter [Pseudorhodoplanes sp.]